MKSFIITFFTSFLLTSLFAQEIKKEVSIDINGVAANVQLDVSKKRRKVKLDEVYFWYKPNRVVQTVGGYHGQLLHGYYVESYSNGQLKLKGYFCLGQQCGEWKYWNEEGKLQRVEHWKQNKLHGEVIYLNDKGEIALEKKFKKGVEESVENNRR